MTKQSLRYAIREALAKLGPNEFSNAGQNVAKHLLDWIGKERHLLGKNRIVLFNSLGDEIDINPTKKTLENLGFEIYFMPLKSPPKAALSLLVKEFGIPDLIIVPGRAFDLFGHRLGRGIGFYDRFFAIMKEMGYPRPLLMGLALDTQVLEYIPSENHDVAMHYICTPSLGVRERIGE